jgi:hypothetical protein
VDHDPLRFGIRALYQAGLRITELAEMSPVATATIKRYVNVPGLARGTAPREQLSRDQIVALTRYWCLVIDQGARRAPGRPRRQFLDVFCPVCTRLPRETCSRLAAPQGAWWPENRVPTLEHAIYSGTRMCLEGAVPCASSPARFAAVIQYLGAHPFRAYQFLWHHVGPDRWWLRACSQCGRQVVTESKAHQMCEGCRRRVERRR